KRDAEIKFCECEGRLRLQRRFKLFLRLGKALLTHVSDTDTVVARSFGAGRVRIGDRDGRRALRISGSEYLAERKNRASENYCKYQRVGRMNAHWHELEIILSRAEIGSNRKETMTELHYSSLATIAKKVRDKEVTPQELAEHYLQRIEKLQPKLNAFA